MDPPAADHSAYGLTPSGPRDVPELRLTLLKGWRPDGPYAAGFRHIVRHHPRPEVTAFSPGFDPPALAHAGLWWVSSDMTHLVGRSSMTLPETTLTDSLMPSPSGFAVFADPLVGTDAETGAPIAVHALLWGLSRHHGHGRLSFDPDATGESRCLTISCYGRVSQGADGSWSTRHATHEGLWVPVGRTDWHFGANTADPTTSNAQHAASMQEERRWLAALWLISSQPRGVAETSDVWLLRQQRRRNLRAFPDAGNLASAPVRLVDVRRPPRPAEPTHGRKTTWTRRWIVEGHWRQQACGPGRSERRPVYIHEFVKGPADKPLVLRERVNVVQGPE
jgi:hypothetical protein